MICVLYGAKKTLVSEVFGRHPSDQCRAFNYFISHIYNNFHHLVTDNLQWWFENGLMERSAAAIEEKLGARYADRFAAFIDCNCLRTDRPGGGPQEDGPGAQRWNIYIILVILLTVEAITRIAHHTDKTRDSTRK